MSEPFDMPTAPEASRGLVTSFEPTDAPNDILDDPIRMLTPKVETLYHKRNFSPTILRYSGEVWRSFAHSSMSGARS
jgi:hypothetical protein